MEQCCSIKDMDFSSKRENFLLQWAFKLISSLDAEETWELQGYTLKVIQIHVHYSTPKKLKMA
jgi:hypothetical protein